MAEIFLFRSHLGLENHLESLLSSLYTKVVEEKDPTCCLQPLITCWKWLGGRGGGKERQGGNM